MARWAIVVDVGGLEVLEGRQCTGMEQQKLGVAGKATGLKFCKVGGVFGGSFGQKGVRKVCRSNGLS